MCRGTVVLGGSGSSGSSRGWKWASARVGVGVEEDDRFLKDASRGALVALRGGGRGGPERKSTMRVGKKRPSWGGVRLAEGVRDEVRK